MDFKSLFYFVTVAKELNITRASEKLNMSQPPLSNQILKLEEELGTQLFIRGKRSLSLTESGSHLLRRANQILDLAGQTKDEIKSMADGLSGKVFLGIVEGRAPFLAADFIKGFSDEFPNVKYELWNGSGDGVLDRLNNGLDDLGILAAPYDNEHLDGIFIGSEPWVAMIPSEHMLAREEGTSVDVKKLSGIPLIIPARKSRVESVYKMFASVDAVANVICETSNYLDAIALTQAGIGISIFPQTVTNRVNGISVKPISNPNKKVTYYLVKRKDSNLSEVAEEFWNFVQDTNEE